jgi:UDP-N-acetylglucosamine--N-acetylmuramyl-(pentapeptide) pyrophosphoryl-undecaprenol N-acetylglucosamine transferase
MRLLIAGGGTGGHLFPGVAIADELRRRDPSAQVLFVGTARGIEARILPGLGWPLERIDASGIKTVGALGALRGLLRVPRAMWQSRRILRQFRPDAVIGVGGYASGPCLLMARLTGVPTGILEQNSIPGLANKILGRFVHGVFLAFGETRRFFRASKIQMTGNPVRREIAALAAAPPPEPDGSERLRLLVFGGSQGARRVNELMVGAARQLRTRVDIVHQTGADDLGRITSEYGSAGIGADCRAFIDDMAAEYRRADLVIARSGATTVAELAVAGCPAILIPYPHAADNHQEINAREVVAAGAALMFRQSQASPEMLAGAIDRLAGDRASLGRMGSAMKALGRPDAASSILDWCEAHVS